MVPDEFATKPHRPHCPTCGVGRSHAPHFLSWEEILSLLDEFRKAIQARDESEVNELLVRSISGFKPYSGLNDLIFVSKNGSNTSN